VAHHDHAPAAAACHPTFSSREGYAFLGARLGSFDGGHGAFGVPAEGGRPAGGFAAPKGRFSEAQGHFQPIGALHLGESRMQPIKRRQKTSTGNNRTKKYKEAHKIVASRLVSPSRKRELLRVRGRTSSTVTSLKPRRFKHATSPTSAGCPSGVA
jgi:hypothetical protein